MLSQLRDPSLVVVGLTPQMAPASKLNFFNKSLMTIDIRAGVFSPQQMGFNLLDAL